MQKTEQRLFFSVHGHSLERIILFFSPGILQKESIMVLPSCHQRLKEPIKGCADMKRITHPDPPQTQMLFYKERIYSSEVLDGLRRAQHSTTQAKRATKAKSPLPLTVPSLVEQGFHWLMVRMSLLLGT